MNHAILGINIRFDDVGIVDSDTPMLHLDSDGATYHDCHSPRAQILRHQIARNDVVNQHLAEQIAIFWLQLEPSLDSGLDEHTKRACDRMNDFFELFQPRYTSLQTGSTTKEWFFLVELVLGKPLDGPTGRSRQRA